MRYISLFLFVVVIGISSVAEGQKYDKSSPKYSKGQRVKQETLDWSEKWPGLGCDSEQSCMELLAQYVEGGEEQGATTEQNSGGGQNPNAWDDEAWQQRHEEQQEQYRALDRERQDRIVELEAQLQAANEEITSLQEAHLERPGLLQSAGPCGKGTLCRDGTCSPCPE